MSAEQEAQLARIRETCKMIVSDMEADTNRWEGAIFTGRNVAEQFGEIRATLAALATMLEILARAGS